MKRGFKTTEASDRQEQEENGVGYCKNKKPKRERRGTNTHASSLPKLMVSESTSFPSLCIDNKLK